MMSKNNQSVRHFLKILLILLFLPLKVISGQSDCKSWMHDCPVFSEYILSTCERRHSDVCEECWWILYGIITPCFLHKFCLCACHSWLFKSHYPLWIFSVAGCSPSYIFLTGEYLLKLYYTKDNSKGRLLLLWIHKY